MWVDEETGEIIEANSSVGYNTCIILTQQSNRVLQSCCQHHQINNPAEKSMDIPIQHVDAYEFW